MKFWLDTLSVNPDNLARPRKKIFDALTAGLSVQPEFEIFRSIVGTVPVLVVNALAFVERTAQRCFHNEAVFQSPIVRADSDKCVSVVVGRSIPCYPIADRLRLVVVPVDEQNRKGSVATSFRVVGMAVASAVVGSFAAFYGALFHGESLAQ